MAATVGGPLLSALGIIKPTRYRDITSDHKMMLEAGDDRGETVFRYHGNPISRLYNMKIDPTDPTAALSPGHKSHECGPPDGMICILYGCLESTHPVNPTIGGGPQMCETEEHVRQQHQRMARNLSSSSSQFRLECGPEWVQGIIPHECRSIPQVLPRWFYPV